MATVSVVGPEGVDPVAVEILEQSIVAIASAFKAVNQTRLTRKALIVLLHDSSKVPKRDIDIVLEHLEAIERLFLKPKAATPVTGKK